MTRAAILNVTGYAGAELARILHHHPDVDLVSVTGRSAAGKDLAEVFPHLRDIELTISPDVDEPVDVVFSALPHAASAERVGPFLEHGVAVVDISADFRLKDRDIYESWYQVDHPYPQYIEEAVYGLPELHRPDIARTKLTANPGCFPTGAILGMAPSVSEGVVEPDVVYDAKTGVSGAGRSGNVKYNFSELNDNTQAYSVSGHRHQPEMTQELSALSSDGDVSVTFTPHLVPMTRGILGTCYARLNEGVDQARIDEIYRDFYAGEPFVTVVSESPSTKQTWASNQCLVHPVVNKQTGRLIVVTALDNLVKGAAGSGVQNMNVMLGMDETAGLKALPVYP